MRGSPRSPRTLAVTLALAALAGGSCTPGDRDLGDPSAREPSARTSTARPTTVRPSPDAPRASRQERGFVRITVRDREGRARAGVPVAIAPLGRPVSRTLLTDADGVARAALRPGRYDVEVPPGCAGNVKVDVGDGGEAGIVAGLETSFALTIDAERRWQPAPQEWLPEAPWEQGETVRLEFALIDRCPGGRFGRGIDIGYLRFEPSSHLEVLGASRATGEDGRATVRFRCARAGDARLFVVDRDDAADRSNLLSGRVPFFPTADWCA